MCKSQAKRYLDIKMFRKSLLTIVVFLVISGRCSFADNFVYEQMPICDGTGLISQDIPDASIFSSFIVDDVILSEPTRVNSLTVYFTDNSGGVWPGVVNTAHLLILPDPLECELIPDGGMIVSVEIEQTVCGLAITANDLAIDLTAGTWWFGLVPIADSSIPMEFALRATGQTGTNSQWRNPGGGFGLGTDCISTNELSPDFLDMAFRIEGCELAADCEFSTDQVLCDLSDAGNLSGDFVLTGLFTNLQDIPGTHLLLPQNAISPAGAELCFGNGQNVRPLDMPLNNGDSYDISSDLTNDNAIVIKNADPGDEVCFLLTLLGEGGVECCTIEICVVMPPCDCLQIDTRYDEITDVECDSGSGTVDFTYTFQLTNLFGQDVYHTFIAPLGSETYTPNYFFVGPLPSGQSATVSTRITSATPEQLANFLVTIHNEDLSECCSREHMVNAPDCDDGCGLTGTGFVSAASFLTFRGTQINAVLSDFVLSDDMQARYNPGFTLNNLEAPVWLIFDAIAPSAINFQVESQASTPGLTYTVEAWDWSGLKYDVTGTTSESFNTDTVETFPIDPQIHINQNCEVRTRVGGDRPVS